MLCSNACARSLYEHLLDLAEHELAEVQGRGPFDGTANLANHRALLDAIASRDEAQVSVAVRAHNDASRAARPSTP